VNVRIKVKMITESPGLIRAQIQDQELVLLLVQWVEDGLMGMKCRALFQPTWSNGTESVHGFSESM